MEFLFISALFLCALLILMVHATGVISDKDQELSRYLERMVEMEKGRLELITHIAHLQEQVEYLTAENIRIERHTHG